MDLSTFDGGEQESPGSFVIDNASLYNEFEKVRDGRKAKGKRYPLALILTLLMLGKMAGEKTTNGVVDWVEERKSSLRRQLNWPKKFPVNSTYTDALANCDSQDIVKAIASVVLRARAVERCDTFPRRLQTYNESGENLIHTAMDGKVLRGTLGHAKEEQPSVHLLALYECESGIVIAQEAIKSKENEITAAKALLHPLIAKGRILSADAMHTQKEWCANVDAYGIYYLIVAKDNHPGVRQDLLDFFADKDLDESGWGYHKEVQKGHGRLEVREIWTSTQMNEWFQKEWAGIAQVFMLRRYVKKGDKETEEIVYGFTNLPRNKAGAKRLLNLRYGEDPRKKRQEGSFVLENSSTKGILRLVKEARRVFYVNTSAYLCH